MTSSASSLRPINFNLFTSMATFRCRCRQKGGAIEFLTKPFRDQELLDAIQLGLSRDRARRENEEALAALRERFGSLSPREREIMVQVARGRLSKQIAGDIGISEATVKVHRSRAMRKMNVRSLPELGRMVDQPR